MGYYIRVLGTKDVNVPLKEIDAAFKEMNIPLNVSSDGKKSAPWSELELTHDDGTPICVVERNSVAPGELGEEEIEEFLDAVKDAKPATAAKWLEKFLPRVKVIYALQILNGSGVTFGWDAIAAVRETILNKTGGIIQADGEGFSNEEGYHILWQFSENVKGKWWMAILNDQGGWTRFQMELGDKAHRRAFLAGEIPDGVTAAP